jgi:hypothetical protein
VITDTNNLFSLPLVGRERAKEKNMSRIVELQDHLFEQMERLSKVDLKGEKLTEEIKRSNAIVSLASTVISNGNLLINAAKALDKAGNNIDLSPILGDALPLVKKENANGRRQLVDARTSRG